MPDKAKYHPTETPEAKASTTSTPASRESQTRKQSADAGSPPPGSAQTSNDRSHIRGNSSPEPGLSPASPESSNGSGRDLSPYWSDFTAEINSLLWLPTGTDAPDSALNSSSGWSSKTAAHSWFSTSLMAAPNPSSPGIYSPSSIRSAAACLDSEGTAQQSRRIRVHPTTQQKLMLRTWMDASRWTYNLTVEILKAGAPAAWETVAARVMAQLERSHPEWEHVPYQVKRTSVRDACRAMSNVKEFNKQLADAKARGERLDQDFSELHFRSRKNPRQSCYIPDDAVRDNGIYYTILDTLRMAEAVPESPKESRLVRHRGQYWLVVPHPAQCVIETPCGDGVVALDPGVRTFLTFFSETECGKIAYQAFGRIQRLCHWLDDLIGRTDTEPKRRRRRRMRQAQERMRQRMTNLVDELHWQTARWLTSNYKFILLPSFETQDMTRRAGRRIRSKTARMMLSFRHYEFKRRLRWKAWQRGAILLEVSEAYTSRTRSWDGSVNRNLGGRTVVRDEKGFGMDRDVNGARGIFLRALGDSPLLRGLLTQVASRPTEPSATLVSV